MPTINISTIHEKWPYDRQTPEKSMAWSDCNFFLNSTKNTDFLVVYDEPYKKFKSKNTKRTSHSVYLRTTYYKKI